MSASSEEKMALTFRVIEVGEGRHVGIHEMTDFNDELEEGTSTAIILWFRHEKNEINLQFPISVEAALALKRLLNSSAMVTDYETTHDQLQLVARRLLSEAGPEGEKYIWKMDYPTGVDDCEHEYHEAVDDLGQLIEPAHDICIHCGAVND